jgi:undecaprenyl-diphosphatase
MPSHSRRAAAALPLSPAQAVALGGLHGPAELLPISSSGHVAVIPWLLGWSYVELDPELRKSFEVALHAGTAMALLITLRGEVSEAARSLDRRRLALIALSFAPPAVVGYSLERAIEQHLGQPPTIAAALIGGAIAMALADRAPQTRGHEHAGAGDAIWLGIAQASALVPGVSRNGATLVAARLRRFTREDSSRLSRHVALPVIVGATALKSVRLYRRRLPVGAALPFAAGTAAAFLSTLGCTWLIRLLEREHSLLPYALYRTLLGALVAAQLRRGDGPSRGWRTIPA